MLDYDLLLDYRSIDSINETRYKTLASDLIGIAIGGMKQLRYATIEQLIPSQ